MDQKGRGKTKTSYRAGGRVGGSVNVQRIGVSLGQDTEVPMVGEARWPLSPLPEGHGPQQARWLCKIKTGPETARPLGCWCPPTPHSFSKSPPPVSSIYTAILVNNPSFKRRTKGKTKQTKKNKNKKMQTPAHPARACAKEPRVPGPESGGHSFHVPGHSRPVGGGLSDCAGCHHPAGRSLAGKTAAGGPRRGRRGPGEGVAAVLGSRYTLAGLDPGRGQAAKPRDETGSGFEDAATARLARTPLRKHRPNRKPQVEKGDFLFFSFQKRLFERNHQL